MLYLFVVLGQDRVNISVMIQPDDIPEIDEKFTVNLLNVTKPGRLQSAAVSMDPTTGSPSFLTSLPSVNVRQRLYVNSAQAPFPLCTIIHGLLMRNYYELRTHCWT